MKNLMKTSFLALFLTTCICSCADIEIENKNNPDQLDIILPPQEIISILHHGNTTIFTAITSHYASNLDLQADIITSTNKVNNYWNDAKEPRERLNNFSSWEYKDNIEYLFYDCYASIYAANTIIQAIENQGQILEENGIDNTQKHLASAYFLRALSYGHLGYIYDKAYIVDIDADQPPSNLVSYTSVINQAIDDIDTAIDIYANHPAIHWDYILDADFSATEAIKLCKAYAARFMIGQARTQAEAQNLDYLKIRNYAQEAITEDFNPTTGPGDEIHNQHHQWNTFSVNGQGAAFLPVDLQICWLFDNNYPKTFPETGILDPVNTDDLRIETDFFYTESLGWHQPERDQTNLSNYTFIRYMANPAGGPYLGMNIVKAAEMDMIEAEAEYHLGNFAAAKSIIDEGARSTRGALPPLPDSDPETIAHAIWYENMIELHSSGFGTALAYMRRWDRLQQGSILHLPVPGSELNLLNQANYTFGGFQFSQEEGTASGANAWK